ncbi:MAG: ribosome small subunit-dependent GTPase A [Gammaproteobacteria bacterium]|nr:ribosome small subunit-dependent GTPase A [Gammaproteobacteria bacterium]MBU1554658.1 ribosome small subunit-dependent GTPase A [Gammaproteobacteria bacterium]MBU2069121.1 ribosome small subunit-dependent GTPase A [Gammaproteobacteria bacterium]MBU2182624.1 ribosome small subunit-dependent GTPase A [Gammaproteobacteria bacterium]MBU2206551.1 ribosome small subunit-dependent GTPase A [Gammaproteobacteria bacterium]
MNLPSTLQHLGWQAFFQQQLSLPEFEHSIIARVTAHHRSGYELITLQGPCRLNASAMLPPITIGDWLLLDAAGGFMRLLTRKSLFKRKAAGSQLAEQLIAANVDTLIIVCSLNHDFNLSRIERYLTLAHDAGAEPLLVLTKMDLCADIDAFLQQVNQLDAMLLVEVVNALDASCSSTLQHWCKAGNTLAVVGSSGVGKSTLVNTLTGSGGQKTAAIRADDSKGRHTTTGRSMHFIADGAVVMDTPGMRELQLTDCDEGIRRAFADIDALANQCRFSDCQHVAEPGCAVQLAIAQGELEARRLTNYQKLNAEQARNSTSLQQKRADERQFSKLVKSVKALKAKKYRD